MADIVSETRTIIPSFDGLRWFEYPDGDKPAGYRTTPQLLKTNVKSASLINGENGKGAYVSFYGRGFGAGTLMGTAEGVTAWFRDPLGDNTWHEVDNYRALVPVASYTKTQAQHLAVQIGSLGGSQVVGRALDVSIVVNGVRSNILVGRVVNQPGNFFFISLGGDDSSGVKNDISQPFRYLQQANGGVNFTGVFDPVTGVKPGDTLVLRGGTWSDVVGFEGKWMRTQVHTGTAPTGAANQGWIYITAYPGLVNQHAIEDVFYDAPAGCAGSIQGCSTTRAGQGYGKYFGVSNLRIQMSADAAADAAPINLQSNGDYWLVHNNELGPWPSTLVTPNNAKAGGMAGSGVNVEICFNHIHDIDCDANNPDTSALENHGIYIDEGITAPSTNIEIGWNWIHDVPGGSGIQWRDAESGLMTGMSTHDNWIETTEKYGLNFGIGTKSVNAWNNVIRGAQRNAMRWDVNVATGSVFNLVHNLIFQERSTSAYRFAITKESSSMTAGVCNVNHNIIVLEGVASISNGGEITTYHDLTGGGASAAVVDQNLYFDTNGIDTTPDTKDTRAIYGDPLFTSLLESDFTLAAGSPALNACTVAEVIGIEFDFYGMDRPVIDTSVPSGVKNDIGPTEGVGT